MDSQRIAWLETEGFDVTQALAIPTQGTPEPVWGTRLVSSVLNVWDTAHCHWTLVVAAVTPLLWKLTVTYQPTTEYSEVFDELCEVGSPPAVMQQLVRSLNVIRQDESVLVGADLA